MISLIVNLNVCLKKGIKTIASCCGHGKYPMTIIVQSPNNTYDLISGEEASADLDVERVVTPSEQLAKVTSFLRFLCVFKIISKAF